MKTMGQDEIKRMLEEAANSMKKTEEKKELTEMERIFANAEEKVESPECREMNVEAEIGFVGEDVGTIVVAKDSDTTGETAVTENSVTSSKEIAETEDSVASENVEGAKTDDKEEGKSASEIEGVEFIDSNTVSIATDSLFGNKLYMRALLSKETNRRKYLIFEVNSKGEELGTTSCDALFKASEVLAASSKIKHLIQDLDGQYEGQITDILIRMAQIERERRLVPTTTLDIDSCKTFEEFYIKLQKWFQEHLEDVRVGIVEIKGKNHVALVKRAKTGLNEIFKSVCNEIAPNMKSTFIKGELYRRGLLNHDNNEVCSDTQLTISSFVRDELGVNNDKIMSFVFDENVIENMKTIYFMLRDAFEDDGWEEE